MLLGSPEHASASAHGTCIAASELMTHAISKLLIASALATGTGVISVAACTHTNDRVVEPAGGPDASTNSPAVADSGTAPIGPIADPPEVKEPDEDFRLVRAPQLGIPSVTLVSLPGEREGGFGSGGTGGGGGIGGSDLRPVGSGGGYY